MITQIYMVRHGQSPKTEGNERSRGLTEKGKADALRVAELLRGEGIRAFYSSPYRRAMLTLADLAGLSAKEIIPVEALKETVFAGGDRIIPDTELYPLVARMFAKPDYAMPGGESLTAAKDRAVAALKGILDAHPGESIAIGTHGMVMALMMGHFDCRYSFEFLMQATKPDVYRLSFHGEVFVEAARL